MRRYALVLIVATMIIAPFAISRLGHPLTLEKPAQAQEKSKKDKSKKDKSKKDKDAQAEEAPEVEKSAQAQEQPKVEKPTQAQEQPKEPAQVQAQEQPKVDVAAGKALYTQFCQKCHAPGGEGVAKMYKLVKAKIVHLGSKEAQDRSDDFIRKSMTAGCCNPTNKMEKVTEPRPLTSQEVDTILAYVRTLKQQ